MTADNSFLVDATVESIRPEDRFMMFDSQMKWAYISDAALLAQLEAACEAIRTQTHHERCLRGQQSVRRFSHENVAQMALGRLAVIGAQIRQTNDIGMAQPSHLTKVVMGLAAP